MNPRTKQQMSFAACQIILKLVSPALLNGETSAQYYGMIRADVNLDVLDLYYNKGSCRLVVQAR